MFVKSFAVLLFAVAFAFAQPASPVPAQPAGESPAAAPAEMVPVDVMQEELALRDSVMQVRDSLCMVEKDSLRKTVVVEEAKCANWEQSYQVMKQNNEVCAKALGIAIEASEKDKGRADEERRKAAVMSSSSFMGGLLVGALLFWLIFD
ncbi:MAG: hypothetical protein J6P30_08935 [Fibrobacter sp.]|nr:hypothetical protein [Fibrobacter sp.]